MIILPHKKGCVANRCTNAKVGTDRFCHKHRKRFQKDKDPVKYTYNVRKMNAKRRKKEFTWTLDEFRDFCERTGYMDKKGIKKNSMCIDRCDNDDGYHAANVAPLTMSENSRKRHEDHRETEDDVPF